MRLTDRDREILRLVHCHRFLRSDHLTSLLHGSRQQTLRRLQLLYHHGYLERPRCQIDYYHHGGSRSIAYGLGNKGAGWLKRALSLPYHRLDWPKRNAVARLFLEHALLVSDVMIAVELACRNQPKLRLLTSDDVSLPANSVEKREPFQWTVSLGNQIKCGVVPDRVFGLEFTDKFGNRQKSWFCLEADRGTMPITRANHDQSSFQRKLLAYEATWTQNLHHTRFGWQRFRVLTVTSDTKRITTMQQAAQSLKRGHGLFLFAAAESVRESGVLTFGWDTARAGVTTTLLG